MKQFLIIAVVVALAIAGTTLLSRGPRAVSTVENIDGVPFPPAGNTSGVTLGSPEVEEDAVLITEKLAHADIYLQEPVLAKQLKLTVTFTPLNTTKLEVGIRDNPFWLSYLKHELYSTKVPSPDDSLITKTITIPLTDKLSDKDGSIDLMFFADSRGSTTGEDEGINDKTLWQLHQLSAEVVPTIPTIPALKDYVRGIIKREQAL